MIIAQISDTHIDSDASDSGRRLADFERTVADINALDPLPDAIVHTGDVVHNGRADEYAKSAAVLAKARAPVYVLPGNKDDRDGMRGAFAAGGYFPRDSHFIQYAVETARLRLIAVDTLSLQSNKGDFCGERADLLASLLAADTAKPMAVFSHHPPFEVSEGPDPLHFETREALTTLRSMLRMSGRVVAVISGHVHRAVAGDVDGIPGIVMPSTATDLRYGYPAHMRQTPVYYIHRFDPQGGFTSETRVVGRP